MMTIPPEVAAAAERRNRRKSESFEKVYGMDYWLSDRDDAALIDYALSLIARNADDGEQPSVRWMYEQLPEQKSGIVQPSMRNGEIGCYVNDAANLCQIFIGIYSKWQFRSLCDALNITTKEAR